MITTLRQTLCLHCGGAGLELKPDGKVSCKFCGTVNHLPGTVCPRCECVSAPGVDFCENCQRQLFQVCPNCQTKNWSGDARCIHCGRALDALDKLIDRLQEDTFGRLNRQQREATAIKATEDAAAERRLEQLRAIDRRREQAQNEAMASRARRERQIFTIVSIIVGVVLIAALAGIVISVLPR